MNRTELLQKIAARTGRHGVLTADRYFNSVTQCVGGKFDTITSLGTQEAWEKALQEAAQKFSYSADDTLVDVKSICKGDDAVNNCIMRYETVITTTKRDRDRDVLETAGATVDPHMPLLWQHIPIQPIGKMLRVTLHTDDMLKGLFAIANTELGRDAAALVDMGALRTSHGFDPEEFDMMPDDDGWHFTKFTIYETSLVSVPSNTDAVITAFSREKLHSPLVKAWAQKMYDERPVIVPVTVQVDADMTEQAKSEVVESVAGNTDEPIVPDEDEDANEELADKSVETQVTVETPVEKDVEKEFMAKLVVADLRAVEKVEKQVVQLANALRRRREQRELDEALGL